MSRTTSIHGNNKAWEHAPGRGFTRMAHDPSMRRHGWSSSMLQTVHTQYALVSGVFSLTLHSGTLYVKGLCQDVDEDACRLH